MPGPPGVKKKIRKLFRPVKTAEMRPYAARNIMRNPFMGSAGPRAYAILRQWQNPHNVRVSSAPYGPETFAQFLSRKRAQKKEERQQKFKKFLEFAHRDSQWFYGPK